MQSSKEVVRRAVEFDAPEWIPIEALATPTESDLVLVGSAPQYWHWREIGDGVEECLDENGCLRRRLNGKTLGEIVSAPLEEWEYLDSFEFPPWSASWQTDAVQQASDFGDKYVMGDMGLALYTAVALRRMDNFFCDVALESPQLGELLDKVLDRKLAMVHEYASLPDIQAVAWYDDWGAQDRLLISPESWRRLLKPRYERLIHEIHRCGIHAYWHCCGCIWEILPDMIEIGTDIINLDQPRLMGIDRLGEYFGGTVCFSCPVDIQATLPKGDVNFAQDEARQLARALGSSSGGFIGKVYCGSDIHLEIDSDVIAAYLKVFRSHNYV